MNSAKILTGILAGFAAGAVIGILFAPEKGSVTRKRIADKSDDYTGELKARYDELRNTVRGKFTDAKRAAMELVTQGKEAIEVAKEDAGQMAWEAKNAEHQHLNA